MSAASVATTAICLVIFAIVLTFATVRTRKVLRENRQRSQAREAALMQEVMRMSAEKKASGTGTGGPGSVATHFTGADETGAAASAVEIAEESAGTGQNDKGSAPVRSVEDEMRSFFGNTATPHLGATAPEDARETAEPSTGPEPEEREHRGAEQARDYIPHNGYGTDHYCEECTVFVGGRIVRRPPWD